MHLTASSRILNTSKELIRHPSPNLSQPTRYTKWPPIIKSFLIPRSTYFISCLPLTPPLQSLGPASNPHVGASLSSLDIAPKKMATVYHRDHTFRWLSHEKLKCWHFIYCPVTPRALLSFPKPHLPGNTSPTQAKRRARERNDDRQSSSRRRLCACPDLFRLTYCPEL